MLFSATYAALWLLVAIQGLIICVVIRQLAQLRTQAENASGTPHRLPIGTPAPDFVATLIATGESIYSSNLHGRRVVILFLATDCSTCRRLARELAGMARDSVEGLVIYCQGSARACESHLLPLIHKLPVLSRGPIDVAAEFRLSGLPVAVIIDEHWRIAGFRYPTQSNQLMECLTRPNPAVTDSGLEVA